MTKAAASTARAQPAESRDRKYDKHLSYSATWGRSAGPAGSREGGGRGQKSDPEARCPRCLRGFRGRHPGRSGAAASAAGTLPDASVSGCASGPRRWPNGRMGTPSGAGGHKMPLARGDLCATLEIGHQIKSTFRAGRKRVASFVASWATVQTPQPAACPGGAHTCRRDRRGEAGRSEAPFSAQKVQVDRLYPQETIWTNLY